VPSKKQRRRREKMQRHEWEFVRYDDEGNEVTVEPAQVKKAETKKAGTNGKAPTGRSGRPLREAKPPSWNRALKRAALFVPFLLVFLSIGKNPPPIAARIGIAVLYAAVFVPMFYFVDRLTYRAYQRRLGGNQR
jgi:hypothetical protein